MNEQTQKNRQRNYFLNINIQNLSVSYNKTPFKAHRETLTGLWIRSRK